MSEWCDETPLQKLNREVLEHRSAVARAYERATAANIEYKRQSQLLETKRKELEAVKQAAANKPKTGAEQYFSELRRSRQGMSFNRWQLDATKNKDRQRLYIMYGKLIRDKVVNTMQMPGFGKFENGQ